MVPATFTLPVHGNARTGPRSDGGACTRGRAGVVGGRWAGGPFLTVVGTTKSRPMVIAHAATRERQGRNCGARDYGSSLDPRTFKRPVKGLRVRRVPLCPSSPRYDRGFVLITVRPAEFRSRHVVVKIYPTNSFGGNLPEYVILSEFRVDVYLVEEFVGWRRSVELLNR